MVASLPLLTNLHLGPSCPSEVSRRSKALLYQSRLIAHVSLSPGTEQSKYDDGRPRKRLKDLHWPAEPDPTLWDDPLQRDEIKPMRHSELEAIGAHSERTSKQTFNTC